MRAAIIAIGTELLGFRHVETNSLTLANMLDRYGVMVCRKAVVPDDAEILAEELRGALDRHELVIATGGLGPTEDDMTKDVVSSVLGIPLVPNEAILTHIRRLFEDRGLSMPEPNRKQSLVFEGQRSLWNARGTAPGFHLNITWGGKQRHLWIFPGVPAELEGMMEADLEPWLEAAGSRGIHRRIVRLAGLTESMAEEQLRPFYARHGGEPVTILAARGEIQVHLRVRGDADEAYPRLTAMEQELRGIFGSRVFGLDDETLESVVGRLLASRGETVSVAESCTGGLLASRITDVSGSSAYFLGGAVAYSRQAKLFLVGVDPKLIDEHGEVSEEVARDMASGVRRRFGTTWGVAITGIAGPTGGTQKKPVGTVHIAAASRAEVRHRPYLFHGSREQVKQYSTQMALNLLRLMMTGE